MIIKIKIPDLKVKAQDKLNDECFSLHHKFKLIGCSDWNRD
ncbi:hypothetical protein Mucpa_1406 [Mucilaginibacter paludis DSM 18603]|uniref:Uncharacterized protein n=1 Tax=Mucilaginibacter paludis DSM 18603 TaxID=714943 RepID=H1YI18_9SPHI|nr:hypothetical protein Mucpa_1406 [Mucilaginibacter paludis DSM 18603]